MLQLYLIQGAWLETLGLDPDGRAGRGLVYLDSDLTMQRGNLWLSHIYIYIYKNMYIELYTIHLFIYIYLCIIVYKCVCVPLVLFKSQHSISSYVLICTSFSNLCHAISKPTYIYIYLPGTNWM